MERNMKALKNAYLVAKGAASPKEIIDFRLKYHISDSTFSIILGFSKNTISNIENEGITPLLPIFVLCHFQASSPLLYLQEAHILLDYHNHAPHQAQQTYLWLWPHR